MTRAVAPKILGKPGRELWSSILDRCDLDPTESAILLQTCTTLDAITELDAIIAREGPMLDGKAHPALVERRQQQGQYVRSLAALRLPDTAGQVPQHRSGPRGPYRLGKAV